MTVVHKIINGLLSVFFLYLGIAWSWGFAEITQVSAVCAALVSALYFLSVAIK